MKQQSLKVKLMALIGVLGLSWGVHAKSVAHVQQASPVVLEYAAGGGMPGPGGLQSQRIVLLQNGDVISTVAYWPKIWNEGKGTETTTLVARISNPVVLRKISALVQQVTGEALVSDPSLPQCLDAPTVTKSVMKGGVKHRISQTMQCVQHEPKSEEQHLVMTQLDQYFDVIVALGALF